MKKEYKPIVNSDLIGDYVTIELPGFSGRKEKPEPCRIHYLTMGSGEPLLLIHSVGQSIYTWRELMPLLAGFRASDIPTARSR